VKKQHLHYNFLKKNNFDYNYFIKLSFMQKSNIARVRNILSGNFTERNFISTGYESKQKEREENEIWEDSSGKKFTKKNGIVRSVSKLSDFRKTSKTPLVCPHCGKPMILWQDEHMWKKARKCFSCVIEDDTKRIINGTFDQFQKDKIKQNTKSWLNDLEQACLEVVEGIDSESFITEMGDIEDWNEERLNKTKLKESVKEQLSELKQKLDNYE